ncbi:MAG TPA: ABC transporter ATP-binding protein [Phycisphaerae bacterium]|nr:ABC transporter ATP-binding protein [Phycisphaerales bacterium]HRX85621.1 ABC transporter ATP-binding protein [Phycisphaerae bacterium]
MTAPIVVTTDLCKEYRMGGGVVRALDRVSLSVRRGELVAIMGASGSGKSTLLHLIGGLDFPTSGTVAVEGEELTGLSDRARTIFRRRRLGVVFQSFNLLPTLSAVENVALPMLVDGAGRDDFVARAEAALRLVDMGHRLRHRPEALSGGEQQRVAIARALLNDPAVVLADEPTGNLDSDHAESIWGLLRRLVDDEQRTVVAVTHEPSGARHADRIVVLRDGRIVGTIAEPGGLDASLVSTRYAELVG